MRCYNCNKNFDYEKYYGICPKCGCFNQRETQVERHGELHDRFGDDSDHRAEGACGQSRTYTSYSAASSAGSSTGSASFGGVDARERTKKKKGSGFLIFSILVFILGILILIPQIVRMAVRQAGSGVEEDDTLSTAAHEAGESFAFQQGSLQVLEIKKLADQNTLAAMEEGMELVAVHVAGQGDGMYEDYNRLAPPYLEVDGVYHGMLSAYAFEPYGQMLGAFPVLDEWALMGEESCDGWYAFLVEEGTSEARFWIDEYDGSDWDGGRLLAGHYVDLTIEAEESGAKGGETDEQ